MLPSVETLIFKIILEEFKDWKYSRDVFELNKEGYGKAVPFSKIIEHIPSLFANELQTMKDLIELSQQSGMLHRTL